VSQRAVVATTLRPARRRRGAYPEEKRRANAVAAVPEETNPQKRTRRQTRFESMSNQIVARIDEMGQRIDDLEKSIGELTDAAGIDPDVGEEKA
jgi:hypothetical protein